MNAPAQQLEPWQLASTAADVELVLLGACMTYATATHAVMAIVSDEHFVEGPHVRIWRAMKDLATEGRPVNPVTLGAVLGNETISADLTMHQYIAHIATDLSCPAHNVVDFAKHVRELWALRTIAARCDDTRSYALSPGARPRDLISDLIQELDGTRAVLDSRKQAARFVGDGVSSLLDRLDRKRQGEVIDSAIPTTLRDLDRKLGGGFKAGELIVIAGRPGMGKSLLAASMARQMATENAGGFFSLEMLEDQVTARLISDALYNSTNPLTASQIMQNDLSDDEAARVMACQAMLKDLPLLIDDSSNLTVGEVGARVRSWKNRLERRGKKLSFIVIDYLKFLRASERYRGQRHYEVGEITAGLKALAKDLGIAVILLVQLNREVEKTNDKRPELSHLRESGDIEADADVVLLLYREAYYLLNSRKDDPEVIEKLRACENKLEIIVAKQRMGSTGSIELQCHAGASAVRDLMRGY
jgi:replicative DNA helicase